MSTRNGLIAPAVLFCIILSGTSCAAVPGAPYDERVTILTVLIIVIALLMVPLIILFVKNNKTSAEYKNQLITLSTMYDTVPDMLVCKDLNLAYTNCNRRFEEFAGLREADLVGKTVQDIADISERISYDVTASDRIVLDEKTVVRVQSRYTYPDGKEILVETIKSPLIRDGTLTGLLTIIRDITELKTTMDELLKTSGELEEALKVKNDFLAKMSHEIRTPMNAIIGMTELALREELPGSAREHIITAKQAGVNLLSIINDLLDFSRIESGEVRINPSEYQLSSLLIDVISIIRMRVVDSRIRFAVNLDSNLPNSLIGDESRIRQALINVLGNAVKYTEKGYVYLKITGEMTSESAITLKIEVEDSGRGIKPESIVMLFDNYYQVDTVSSNNADGVGLGLPITKSIVEAMDGDISVESEYGKGSTFTVKIPQKIAGFEKLAGVGGSTKISALVYERRGVYSASIVYAIRNLGVKCVLAKEKSGFFEQIANGSHSFVFLSYPLYDECKDELLKYRDKVKVVLLTEFGQATPNEDLHVLSLPVHAISIANLFNGIADSFSYYSGTELAARFTAPDASILVVDDIQTNLKVISGLMAPYKMDVDLCQSGAEAVKAVKAKDYDLVLMDHRMPDMDGVEATLEIRAMGNADPRLKTLPIVALTANAVAGMKEMFLDNGFNDFLHKPVDTVKLNSVMEKWLPKEKLKGASEDAANAAIVKDVHDWTAIEVDGLDTGKGILMSGDDIDLYCETLAIYCDDALSRIEKLRECLETNDIDLYITYVHALKSACANVGADKLASQAYDLETAAHCRDMLYISTNNERFLTKLKTMVDEIRAGLSALNPDTSDAQAGDSHDPGRLADGLKVLKNALDDMAAGAIDRAVADLSVAARTREEKATVKKISKHILMGEFDEVIEFVESVTP